MADKAHTLPHRYSVDLPTGGATMMEATARDWWEDDAREDGRVLTRCIRCQVDFFGHRRRTACKLCMYVSNGLPAVPPVPHTDHE